MTEIFQKRKMARAIPIPTNDKDVKTKLREIGKPICLFGEKDVDRRERIKKEVEEIVIKTGDVPDAFIKGKYGYNPNNNLNNTHNRSEFEDNEIFYTEGSTELHNARIDIIKYSLPRSSYRIENAKKCFMELDRIQEGIEHDNFLNNNKNYEFISSQIADERGCARGCLTPDDNYYGVAGLSGICNIFSLPELKKVTTLRGHGDKVNCIKFNPMCGGRRGNASENSNEEENKSNQNNLNNHQTPLPMMAPNIATCSSDNTIKLWSFDPSLQFQKSTTFKGHEDRVNMIDFHPTGRYLGSTSHDKTFRLWDIEAKKELLLQEGHSAPVFGISFQQDGALVATTDLSGIGHIWDLRSGRSIFQLQGHVKQILSVKFSGNCYQVATGGDDNTLKIWDLRRRQCAYTVLAHNGPVSDITFEHSDSKFMLTCSYDSSFKMWNNRDWSIVESYMSVGESKLSSISLSRNGSYVVTASLDRTVKLWNLNRRSGSKEERMDLV